MKTTARKVLCMMMVLVLVLSVSNSVTASAFRGAGAEQPPPSATHAVNTVNTASAAHTAPATQPETGGLPAAYVSPDDDAPPPDCIWTDNPYYHLKQATLSGQATWPCVDEKEYFLTHGRIRHLADYLNL